LRIAVYFSLGEATSVRIEKRVDERNCSLINARDVNPNAKESYEYQKETSKEADGTNPKTARFADEEESQRRFWRSSHRSSWSGRLSFHVGHSPATIGESGVIA
jgi:hypothetical protein